MHVFFQIHTHELFTAVCDHLAYTPHIHTQLEVLFVDRGFMDVTVGDQSARLGAGEMAVIFPHHLHSFKTLPGPDGDGEGVTVILLNPPLTGDYAERVVAGTPAHPFLRRDDVTPDIREAIQKLLWYSQSEHPDRFQPIVAKSYAQLLLTWLWPPLEVIPAENASLQSSVWQAIQYMAQHFRQPLSPESVATALGISTRQLSRLFATTIRIGFHEYLLDLRTEHACGLLRSTPLSITDIAFQTGFESPRTFNRAFQKFYGVTPREYRRRYQPAKNA